MMERSLHSTRQSHRHGNRDDPPISARALKRAIKEGTESWAQAGVCTENRIEVASKNDLDNAIHHAHKTAHKKALVAKTN